MSTKITYALIILALSLFSGCKTYHPSTTETLYLQEIEVAGSINQPPIHLTDSLSSHSITLTPRFSYNTKSNIMGKVDGHTRVNQDGVFQVDTFYNNGNLTFKMTPDTNKYIYNGQNLTWDVATVYAALDLDVKVFKNLSAFCGINFSLQNKLSIWGGRVGFGLFTAASKSAIRLDLGLHIQEIAYNSQNVLLIKADPPNEEQDNDVYFLNDIGKSIHFNPFISLTYNTANREWFINFFLNAGYSGQTIVNFPSEDKRIEDVSGYVYRTNDVRGENISGFWNFTPGIYFFIGESSRLLLGARFFFQTLDKKSEPSDFILPMVQFDFGL